MPTQKTITPGDRFGRWTALEKSERRGFPCGKGQILHECRCDCGETQFVRKQYLTNGKSKSCGCRQAEEQRQNSLDRDSSVSRICSACDQEKPHSDFYWTTRRNGERARHSKCRQCRRDQFKAWRETPQGREWKRIQTYNIYGIDLAIYASMLEVQGGACAICRNIETKKRNGRTVLLAVDHDHATGEVRGLLCHKCNSGLGAFRDNQALVASALTYLQRSAQPLSAASQPAAGS